MTTLEIKKILGISPTTFSDWGKVKHSKNDLYKLLKAIDVKQAKDLISQYDKNNKPSMLTMTINCSIGDESKHLSDKELKKIIINSHIKTPMTKYVLKTIQNEATQYELKEFSKKFLVPYKKLIGVKNGQY